MDTRLLFGQALRRVRQDLGIPPQMLAAELGMSESKLYKLERAKRRPNPEDGPAVDGYFRIPGGLFAWLGEISRDAREPYGSLLAYEPQASAIRVWENRVVPGLLQTEAYARALLRDEEKVAERLARRDAVFARDAPATVRVVLDEAVLRRVIGDRATLAGQLAHVIRDDAPWHLHVLPQSVPVPPSATDGPVTLLDVDGTTLAYAEGWEFASIMDTPGQIRAAWDTWDAILGVSLSEDASRTMIASLTEELT